MQPSPYISTRIAALWTISLCSALLFVLLSSWVIAGGELQINPWLQEFQAPMWTLGARLLTFIGSKGPIIVIALWVVWYLYAAAGRNGEIKLFLLVLLGSEAWNVVLKLLFHRVRPDVNRLIEITGYSYPSGHSMAAFSLYGVLCYLLWSRWSGWKGRLVLLAASSLMILGIGMSRVYLGVHYPSDVAGAYAASLSWLLFCIGFYEYKWLERSPAKAS
ncbi:phosphoesterase PA-phosphatase-like protein [Paenibacillus algicola]|uniref:Phosphoesterase PA-phosphatase-like protein n=1 Tax=Paenibacillus algicola TaxID=2565926 RepID=A0A4P8XLP5_9BACL|nr:phosphatase PAP2 family protein [Paenibacillus algicola]QCT03343.1 phosphoesterase PA-phosphatase-like protein [Paenibacillus algicola]